jgi:hypothetical protein
MRGSSDRRQFLLGSAVAAASAQLRAAGEGEVRVAHIGIGVRGTALVRHVLAEERVRITAVCDTRAEARDSAQSLAKRDNPRSYTEWRQLLDLKDVDAVVIATPCDLHAEMSAACLEAGKYVYCEFTKASWDGSISLRRSATAARAVRFRAGRRGSGCPGTTM